ncbi:hypothetical protein O3P69_006884 [Scylla paramamosain]|uniref:Uncharacterized protein n=1 Tax=Scylla paramamosain TaxID=85552 RepID=A0AAW0U1D2_SCYPA
MTSEIRRLPVFSSIFFSAGGLQCGSDLGHLQESLPKALRRKPHRPPPPTCLCSPPPTCSHHNHSLLRLSILLLLRMKRPRPSPPTKVRLHGQRPTTLTPPPITPPPPSPATPHPVTTLPHFFPFLLVPSLPASRPPQPHRVGGDSWQPYHHWALPAWLLAPQVVSSWCSSPPQLACSGSS